MGSREGQGPGRQSLGPGKGIPLEATAPVLPVPPGDQSGVETWSCGDSIQAEGKPRSQTRDGVCSPHFHFSAAKAAVWGEFAGFALLLLCVLEQRVEDSTAPDLSLQAHGPPHPASLWPTDLQSPLGCRALLGWALRGAGEDVKYPGAAGPHWPSSYQRC